MSNNNYTLINIDNNNKTLEKIICLLTSFHTGTHISYTLTKNYPIFRNNTLFYFLFYSTDIFTHLGIYKITGDRVYLYTFYWHLLKLFDGLFDKSNLLRKSKINYAEVFVYLSALLGLKGNLYYKVLGFYTFTLAKSFGLTW